MTDYMRINSLNKIQIHNIEWSRVNLKLEALVPFDFLNTTYKIYLYNYESRKEIPIKKFNIKGHILSLSINISTIDKENRIPDGEWEIIFEDSRKERIVFQVADNMLNDGINIFKTRYSQNFKSGPKRLYKVHTNISENNELSLSVFFQKPKIKRNKKRITFKRIEYLLRAIIFRSIFSLTNKFVKKNGKRVLFTSASRSSLGGNLKAVHDRMIERNLHEEYTILKSFKPNIWARSDWKDKFKLPFYLGIADKILIEDYQPMVNSVKYSKETDVIQLWHANGAFKTFGYSRLGKPASPRIDGSNHRIYTKAITSSKHVIPYYAEAFAIYEEKVVATGVPKSDIFFDEDYKHEIIKKVKTVYPKIQEVDQVILFGPTFRGGGPKTAYYPMEKIDLASMASYARKNNALILFKMHFLVKNKLEIPEEYSDVLIDATNYREINDLLFVTDLLITDYSSTIYESSLLDIPMLFYAFDLEEYISKRDFYDEFTSFVPGKIVNDFDELMSAINNNDYEYEKVEQFKHLHFEFLDGGASDRVIDWLILEKPENV